MQQLLNRLGQLTTIQNEADAPGAKFRGSRYAQTSKGAPKEPLRPHIAFGPASQFDAIVPI
jgi:hypothetical protein